MEAVGLAASIITLVSATSFAGAALQKLQRLRGTQVHLVAAINEMNDFRATLSFVHSAVDGHEDLLPENSRSELETLLKRSEEDLKNFTHYLETELLRDGKSDTTSPKLRSRAKFKELLGENQSRIDTFCRNFNSIKTALGVALGALSTLQVRTLAIPMTIQHVTYESSCQDPSHVAQQITTNGTTFVMEEMLSQQCRRENGSSVSNGLTNDSQSSNEVAVRKSSSHAATSNNYITIQTRLTPRSCRLGCLCQCHIPVENATPRWLRGVIGTAFFRYAGTPILNRRTCNVPKCGASEKRLSSLSFYYQFPSWLFSTAFEITAQWSDLQGIRPTWALRIPKNTESYHVNRIHALLNDPSISSSHRIWKYMVSNGIRAIDTCGIDGLGTFERALGLANNNACIMLLGNGLDLGRLNQYGLTMAQLALRRYFEVPTLFTEIWELDEIQDMVDTLLLSTLHRIVIGLNDLNLVDHVEEYPEYIHQRDCFGFTPLHWAAGKNNHSAVGILLKAGADVNALCKEGRSVLSWAVLTGSRDLCATLISAGAEINLVDNQGRTSLICALGLVNISVFEVVALLIEHGAHVEAPNVWPYRPPLHEAVGWQPTKVCELLLQSGADIDAQDKFGMTAIRKAVRSDRTENARFLVTRGASLNHINHQGVSLINYVAWYGSIEMMKILTAAKIEGLPMDEDWVQWYWGCFDQRDQSYFGEREEVELEEITFQEFLESIVALPEPSNPVAEATPEIPGAFPIDEGLTDLKGTSKEQDAPYEVENDGGDYEDANAGNPDQNEYKSYDSLDILQTPEPSAAHDPTTLKGCNG